MLAIEGAPKATDHLGGALTQRFEVAPPKKTHTQKENGRGTLVMRAQLPRCFGIFTGAIGPAAPEVGVGKSCQTALDVQAAS